MRVTSISAASVPSVFSHSDRVTGVLAGRPELDALTRALESLGVGVIEVLEGTPGAGYLDRREHSFQAFLELFLGDLETETRHHYAQEVERGRLVFAVPVTEGNKEDVVDAVLAHGAGHVVHFGRWVGTSFGQSAAGQPR
jgi:hypothetical protein